MNFYLGTALIALASLALEVTFTRLLSVVSWYYMAFFSVSTAMLGMTAGAVTVYLRPDLFTENRLSDNLAKACLGYSLVVPFALIVLCITPMVLKITVMSLFVFVQATFACMLPFYFSGIAVTAVLTKSRLPTGRLYASDLIGASLGCLFVLCGLEIIDAPSLILLTGAVAALAALFFARDGSSFKIRRRSRWILGIVVVLAFVNSSTTYGIRPFVVKGRVEGPRGNIVEKWNSYSRVIVTKMMESEPFLWAGSPLAPTGKKLFQYDMNIDGEAATRLQRFTSFEDIENLRYDMTNIVYHLRSRGGACIIGVGGGRDVQSAVFFGHQRIVGIDLNPIFIDLLRNRFRKFAGIADRKEVTLVVDEARSYLSRTRDKYSVIQMTLIDTWAATGAGAFSLSENSLYTREAWRIFVDRLSDDGIFTVTRWYNPKFLGETGRLVSLAMATLIDYGITKPSDHIAMFTMGHEGSIPNVATLLLSKQPFSLADVRRLKEIASVFQFNLVIVPGTAPADEILRKMLSESSIDGLKRSGKDAILNLEAPTDENPYFFNMLKLSRISAITGFDSGLLIGNLSATLTLVGLILSLTLVTIVTVILPLALRRRGVEPKVRIDRIFWQGAAYFSLIGIGFMFVEIALIQRLSVFLGHPVYALGILLFALILSAGFGSLASEHIPLTRAPLVFIYPLVIVFGIITTRFLLPTVWSDLSSSSMSIKIMTSVLVVIPLGVMLGVCFPVGMRLVKSRLTTETPWFWALNGVFSVLSSALAVFVSIFLGISTNFDIAALCYLMILVCLAGLREKNGRCCSHCVAIDTADISSRNSRSKLKGRILDR